MKAFKNVPKAGTSDVCVRVTPTCPCGVREVNLCDESVSIWSRLSEVSRFRMDHVTLAVWIQNLQRQQVFIFRASEQAAKGFSNNEH